MIGIFGMDCGGKYVLYTVEDRTFLGDLIQLFTGLKHGCIKVSDFNKVLLEDFLICKQITF